MLGPIIARYVNFSKVIRRSFCGNGACSKRGNVRLVVYCLETAGLLPDVSGRITSGFPVSFPPGHSRVEGMACSVCSSLNRAGRMVKVAASLAQRNAPINLVNSGSIPRLVE